MIHIHNGDITAALARRLGVPGEHLAFREALIAGPVVPGEHWLESRARFLAEAHGEDLLRTSNALFEQEQALAAATEQDEIVLWFEHDLFCFVHFVYMLQRFAGANVSAVWCRDPIGTVGEEQIPQLFESRGAVTPTMTAIAGEVWRDYTSHDPTALNRWLTFDADFPFLRDALTLHAARFPSTRNGLGAIEQRCLEAIASGAVEFGALFSLIDVDAPRFGFGDSEVLRTLRGLASRAVPLITMTEMDEQTPPPRALFGLTVPGTNVMNGIVDDVTINDPDVWLGGTHVTKETLWRWDAERRQLVPSRPAAS